MVVFIVLDRLFDQILAEAHLLLHLHDKLCVDIKLLGVVGKVIDLRLVKLVKGMTPQSINVDAVFRVGHKDLPEDVLCLRRQKLWKLIVGRQDLLVKVGGLLVLVGQVATQHGV